MWQGCFVAASSMLPDLYAGFGQLDAFTQGCQALFEAGCRLPVANQLLLSIDSLLARHCVQPMPAVRKMISATWARTGKTTIKNVRLITFAGFQAERNDVEAQPHDVGFSDMITHVVEAHDASLVAESMAMDSNLIRHTQ